MNYLNNFRIIFNDADFVNQFFVVIQCNVTRCGEHRQLQLVRRRNI